MKPETSKGPTEAQAAALKAIIKQYTARIDFEGWSDDLCLEIITDAYERGRRDGLELVARAMEERGGGFLHRWIRWIRAQAGQEESK